MDRKNIFISHVTHGGNFLAFKNERDREDYMMPLMPANMIACSTLVLNYLLGVAKKIVNGKLVLPPAPELAIPDLSTITLPTTTDALLLLELELPPLPEAPLPPQPPPPPPPPVPAAPFFTPPPSPNRARSSKRTKSSPRQVDDAFLTSTPIQYYSLPHGTPSSWGLPEHVEDDRVELPDPTDEAVNRFFNFNSKQWGSPMVPEHLIVPDAKANPEYANNTNSTALQEAKMEHRLRQSTARKRLLFEEQVVPFDKQGCLEIDLGKPNFALNLTKDGSLTLPEHDPTHELRRRIALVQGVTDEVKEKFLRVLDLPDEDDVAKRTLFLLPELAACLPAECLELDRVAKCTREEVIDFLERLAQVP